MDKGAWGYTSLGRKRFRHDLATKQQHTIGWKWEKTDVPGIALLKRIIYETDDVLSQYPSKHNPVLTKPKGISFQSQILVINLSTSVTSIKESPKLFLS